MTETSRRAVFLDRDGTLIRERDYLSDPDGVELIPGAAEALILLRSLGLTLVVVTNQSGIGRGLYSLDDYHAVARRVSEQLGGQGAAVDATYFCPDPPEHAFPGQGGSPCRKPATGMHRAAALELGLALERAYFIGDKVTDLLPALELGGTGLLVRTGYGSEEEARLPELGLSPPRVYVVEDLLEAAEWIAERE